MNAMALAEVRHHREFLAQRAETLAGIVGQKEVELQKATKALDSATARITELEGELAALRPPADQAAGE